jgi:hypothetical protein
MKFIPKRDPKKDPGYQVLAGELYEELRTTTSALVQTQRKVTDLTERIQQITGKLENYERKGLEDHHVEDEGKVVEDGQNGAGKPETEAAN